MERFTITTTEALSGDFDLDGRLRRVPRDYLCKGMFFSSVVDALGSDFEAESALLVGPPRLGRYLPFGDYPQVDYARLVGAVIKRDYASAGMREGSRQFARREFSVFGTSTVGVVLMNLVGDAGSALLRFPDMVRTVMKGGEVTAREEDGGVTLSFHRFYGWLDCHFIGVVEGIVQHYGTSPIIDVEIDGWTIGRYRVRWR